jgi:hypothetical protein
MENRLPTAEELLNQKVYITQDDIKDVHDSVSTVTEAMIEFAKLHCEAQLKDILENACMKEYKEGDWDSCWISNDMGDGYVLDKNSIINAYPLTNIK